MTAVLRISESGPCARRRHIDLAMHAQCTMAAVRLSIKDHFLAQVDFSLL